MINLMYCANSGVADGLWLSITSAASKASIPICAYIVTMDLTDADARFTPVSAGTVAEIDASIKRFNAENRCLLVDASELYKAEMAGGANDSSGYTPYTLLRLFAERLRLPSPILYVDADTMFHADAAEILRYDISQYELAGAVDFMGKTFIAGDYLNAGVLYLNLEQIERTGLFCRAREMCKKEKMAFPDQDSLNLLARRKLTLPSRFNEQGPLKSDTVIQHFSKRIRWFPYFKIINVKPWQLDAVKAELRLDDYDEIYADFLAAKGGEYDRYMPKKGFARLRSDIKEALDYVSFNGGIFRRKR